MDKKLMRYYSELSAAAMLKIILIVMAYGAGNYLDRKYHLFPLFTFAFIVGAGALGIWWIVYLATRSNRR